MNINTSNLLLSLDEQRKNLATNLSTKGVAANINEGLEILVPKVLEIVSGGTDNLDMSWVIADRGSGNYYTMFTNWQTVIPDFDKVFCLIRVAMDNNLIICTKENFQNRVLNKKIEYASYYVSGIYVPGAVYSTRDFSLEDMEKYHSGLVFSSSNGVLQTSNGFGITPDAKECFIIIQERS